MSEPGLTSEGTIFQPKDRVYTSQLKMAGASILVPPPLRLGITSDSALTCKLTQPLHGPCTRNIVTQIETRIESRMKLAVKEYNEDALRYSFFGTKNAPHLAATHQQRGIT